MYKIGNKYSYRAFGLNIDSDFYLPELIERRKDKSDINIIWSNVPLEINEPIFNDEHFKISKKEMLFCVDGVARYYIPDDNTIIVNPDDDFKYNSLKLYLLGIVLGTLLLKRGIIPIHGSSIVINGKCIVITGDSGVGKSTLSLGLRKIGHPFLADDISAIIINEEGIPVVLPSYPQQKLWSDSAIELGYDTRNLFRVDDNEDKYTIQLRDGFLNLPVPLCAIFELGINENKNVEMKQVFGMDKLDSFMRNIYMIEILKYFGGIKAEYFKKCFTIAKDTAFFKLLRPKDIFSLDEQIRIVKEKVECLD